MARNAGKVPYVPNTDSEKADWAKDNLDILKGTYVHYDLSKSKDKDQAIYSVSKIQNVEDILDVPGHLWDDMIADTAKLADARKKDPNFNNVQRDDLKHCDLICPNKSSMLSKLDVIRDTHDIDSETIIATRNLSEEERHGVRSMLSPNMPQGFEKDLENGPKIRDDTKTAYRCCGAPGGPTPPSSGPSASHINVMPPKSDMPFESNYNPAGNTSICDDTPDY